MYSIRQPSNTSLAMRHSVRALAAGGAVGLEALYLVLQVCDAVRQSWWESKGLVSGG